MNPTKPVLALRPADDNAFRLQVVTQDALRAAGATPAELKQYRQECIGGHYDHMRAVTQRWVTFA